MNGKSVKSFLHWNFRNHLCATVAAKGRPVNYSLFTFIYLTMGELVLRTLTHPPMGSGELQTLDGMMKSEVTSKLQSFKECNGCHCTAH